MNNGDYMSEKKNQKIRVVDQKATPLSIPIVHLFLLQRRIKDTAKSNICEAFPWEPFFDNCFFKRRLFEKDGALIGEFFLRGP